MATITASEREQLLHHLRRTASAVCDALKTVTGPQWNFRPPEGGWGPADIADHIVESEAFIFHRLQSDILPSPARTGPAPDARDRDQFLLHRVPVRARKVEAPPGMAPARRFTTPAQALEAFRHTRSRTMRYVESTADDLRAHTGEHELLGTLDGYQWLLLVAAHTQRHMAQWAGLRQHQAFPAAAVMETYA